MRESAFQLNQRLGRGINMGNCFEAPTETEWGNPWKPEYFRIMSDLGFKHVRIPIRWEPTARTSWTAPYTIAPTFLSRIKQVVDTALKYKLHVIINMHHHDSLFANPEKQKARFLSQWNQIATTFRNYPDSLLFEVLNEP
ncbi:MAG TPA: cellulase family glycosylhydrolase, partial [Prolixibacteraceae bacterium]|nr:cellulase family glycosylhydrolase [Prolixibacteraceae bacterium]